MDLNFYNLSYVADKVYENDKFDVSLGNGCKSDERERVAIVRFKALGVTIIGGQDLYNLIKSGGTSNADRIALEYAATQWAKEPDKFAVQFASLIEGCYKAGYDDGRRELQSEFRKLMGIAWI
jgi:hypothetical protein